MKKVSTPLNNSPQTPISNVINRSLLTPCRRIGLTRSKKRNINYEIICVINSGSNTENNQLLKSNEGISLEYKDELSTPVLNQEEMICLERSTLSDNENFMTPNSTKCEVRECDQNVNINKENTTLEFSNISKTLECSVNVTPSINCGVESTFLQSHEKCDVKKIASQKRKLFSVDCSTNDSSNEESSSTKNKCMSNSNEDLYNNINIDRDFNVHNCTEFEILFKIKTLENIVDLKRSKLIDLKKENICEEEYDPIGLEQASKKWKIGCQLALKKLFEFFYQTKGNSYTMKKLLNDLNISYQKVNFDAERDCFISDL